LGPTSLIEGRDGNLYGVTGGGGDFGAGTVFKATPEGQETVLYSFAGGSADGANPDTLVQGNDGNFYGVTSSGGISACTARGGAPAYAKNPGPIQCGTVFELTPEGEETILYLFTGGADGGLPMSLIQGNDGYLYGLANEGGIVNTDTGAGGGGVVFRITGPGSEQALYAFDDSAGNGASPQSLMQATDGTFYVTTYLGGAADLGAIVRVTTGGEESVLYSFLGGADGQFPRAPLLEWSDGNFYGVTQFGGTSGRGTFFQLTLSGQETVLYQFGSNTAGGLYPQTLVAGSSGQFVGVTSSGGLVSACGGLGCGTVYQITPSGAELARYQFDPYTYENVTSEPGVAAVIQMADGTLYGITTSGGVAMSTGGGGTLFSLSLDGVFTTLYEFGSGAAAP